MAAKEPAQQRQQQQQESRNKSLVAVVHASNVGI
jgi:hypothetical protein